MVANMITSLRIIGAIILVFVEPLELPFYVIYGLCIGSDVIDGYVARKTHTASSLGAKLDSIGDGLLLLVVLWVVLPVLDLSMGYVYWIVFIASIKILSLGIGAYRYHKLAFLHTYLNKLTGILLFGLVMFMLAIDIDVVVMIVCIVGTLSAVEDCMINATSKELDLDVKGIFLK